MKLLHRIGIGDGAVFGMSLLNRMEGEDILGKADDLMAARFVQGVLGVGSLALLRTIPVLKKTNAAIDNSKVNIAFAEGGTGTPATYAIPVSLPGSLLAAFPGMDFDEAAQDLFDDLAAKALAAVHGSGDGTPLLADRAIDAIGGAISEHIAPDPADNGKRLRKVLAKLKTKLSKFTEDGGVEKTANKHLGKQLEKLKREYGYRRCTVQAHVSLFNLSDGTTIESPMTQQVFNWSDENRDDTAMMPDTSLPLVALGQSQLMAVRLQLSYTTGIRELIKKGMAAYEDAGPLARTGAARYGELGEKAGSKADEFVIKLLSQRTRAEEPGTLVPSPQLLLFRDDGPDATAKVAAEALQQSSPTSFSLHRLQGGTIDLAIQSDGGTERLPVLRVGP
jgi:hypothetical protein